jgi:hypothetical protein
MNFEFRSFNVPRHFIRHRNFLGELTRKGGPRQDFAFRVVQRGGGVVSLGSANFPKRFLRHRDFRIRLEEPNGRADQVFRQDSRFHMVPGLADPNGVSFRSLNLPDHYLRHRDFHLFIDHESSPNLAADATFFKEPAPVVIDRGTELNPVDG